MNPQIPLFPPSASTLAPHVDSLYFYLIAISGFFTFLIFTLVIFFAIKYRQKTPADKPAPTKTSLALEILWSVIPLVLSMTFFVWGTSIYVTSSKVPLDAEEIFVVGKQWMWKIQHPEGRREINELHVPVGRNIKLTMTSEDVIHSFFIPAFRIKMDVLPGRYSSTWFHATKVGEYHLFCAEYCGTNHSGMIGRIVVMEPWAYERWLSGASAEEADSMVSRGARLFHQFNCLSCHGDPSRGPSLEGVYGRKVILNTGQVVAADQAYLRESILVPTAKIVRNYQPLMPSYAGQVNEEQVMQLIAFMKNYPGEPAEHQPAQGQK